MKKTTPASTHEWQTLNLLNVDLAASISGGNTGPATDVTKTTMPVYSTSSSESPATPGGNGGRPPVG